MKFAALDADGDGILTTEELIQGREYHLIINSFIGYMNIYNDRTKAKEEALNIIKKVDINMSGEIDFFEFIIAATD